MVHDINYLEHRFRMSELEHNYGKQVHIVSDPYLFTILAKLCEASCRQPLINQLLDKLYRELVKTVVNVEFPLAETVVETRMAGLHPDEGRFKAKVLDPTTKVICVNLARAGTVPSHICYDALDCYSRVSKESNEEVSDSRHLRDTIGSRLKQRIRITDTWRDKRRRRARAKFQTVHCPRRRGIGRGNKQLVCLVSSP